MNIENSININFENYLISIIMPAYNAAAYIKEAIDSVLAQTYLNWELIIIDDGSTDDTAKIIKEELLKDQRIKYYYQANGKQGKARNLGISKSNGKYLAFLDSDDIWMPQKLEIQVIEIQEKNVDLVFSDSYIFNNSETDLYKRMNIKGAVFYERNSVQLFLKGNGIPILTVLVKKEKIITAGGFSEKLDIQNVEDYHLWLKLLMSNNIFYSSDQVLAKYREHNNSATANDKIVLDKIPNVFFDLLENFPNYQKLIKRELKLKFILVYKNNTFKKQELAMWINKNSKYLSKQKESYMYLLLNFLLPTKVTKRLLIYFLNA
ncbi:hypothetical protein HYN56_01680 [Flavobacterium crocinum]|uniref:Glycosyltransferase 2-like domain-containing protein n=1 Tax=Flavobacterium crocinum TaxID=2183896 RepID=A0A2S1YG25_9FLAO|nr:glycosyltransferase [Flavobacterium crocinum]AWK02993.1 hypothetical protein HYN56_01680 [Flavobacterium crocinum]